MQPSRHNARKKSNPNRVNSDPVVEVKGSHGTFLLLHFVDNYEEIVPQNNLVSPVNPTMSFSGDTVVIDYGIAYERSEDSKNEILSFFDSKDVKDKTITLENGKYTNPVKQLNGDVFDVSGTYTINSFNKENGIVVATKVTADNLSDYMSQYLSDYFIDNLIWTDTTSSMTRKIEENAIVNKASVNSNNSFEKELGILYTGDVLTIKFPNEKETSSFTVKSTRTDEDGHEWIYVSEPVPEDSDGTSYFGQGVYISVSRRLNSTPCDKVSDYDSCVECVNHNNAKCLTVCQANRKDMDKEEYQNCLKRCRCQTAKKTINCHYDHKFSPDTPGVQGMCASNNRVIRDACSLIRQNCEWKTPTNPDPNLPTLDDIMPCVCESCCEAEGLDENPDCPFGCCNCCADDPTRSAKDCDCCQTTSNRSMDDEEETPTTPTQNDNTARTMTKVTYQRQRSSTTVARSSISEMEKEWNNTGRKTINVKVVYENGKRVYSFNGSNQSTEPRPELQLEEGVAYRFNLKDRSLGLQGTHPLSFATSPNASIEGSELERYIVRSSKEPGNRGSYIYFQVPALNMPIHYYCKNHNGMGNIANVMLKRGSDEGPVIKPDVKPGVGPGGGGGVTGINECCDCDNCLMQAIMEVESGDWQNPGAKDPIDMCNARKPGGNGCGHYQIFPDFVGDARGLCPTPGVYSPGAPKIQACCGIPLNAHNLLCADCDGSLNQPFPGTAEQCCQQKKALGELIMACWKRKWTRNQGSGPCRCEGSGPGPVVNDDEDCYTCEDLAKMHKEGRCGHRCCTKPNCCYQGPDADPAEGTDACNRAKQYWNRVKSVMCSIPACANCSDCANVNPPGLEAKPKRPGEERSTMGGYPNSPLLPDLPVGQSHLEWFLWFFMHFDLYPTDALNPTFPGYPPRVLTSYNVLGSIINDEWNQNGLNTILGMWGSGGYPLQSAIPSGYSLVIPPRTTTAPAPTAPTPTTPAPSVPRTTTAPAPTTQPPMSGGSMGGGGYSSGY